MHRDAGSEATRPLRTDPDMAVVQGTVTMVTMLYGLTR
jgi:hypothetical protein